MKDQVNAAVQVLPQSRVKHIYDIVDEAIDEIKRSGIRFQVCPFETVVEGDFDEVVALIGKIKARCFAAGADDVLINIKIQARKDGMVTIEEKMNKYK